MANQAVSGICGGGVVAVAESHDEYTRMFKVKADETYNAQEVLTLVYRALKEKGYSPISQIVGYLLSGDPAYITSHNDARSLVRRLERDELLEELVKSYLEKSGA